MNNKEWRNVTDTFRRKDGYYDPPNSDNWVKGESEVLCCGEWMPCDNFTNTCSNCGADYNMSGSRLAPRSQWGEETGESVEDILSVDHHTAEELLDG